MLKFLSKLKLKVKRFFHPYNQIRMPIPNEYHEVDDQLFYAIRTIFLDYIEIEMPFMDMTDDRHWTLKRYTDINEMRTWVTACHNPTWMEILKLYEWFKITQPEMQKAIEDSAYDHKLIQELYHEETKRLMRLVELRKYLWT